MTGEPWNRKEIKLTQKQANEFEAELELPDVVVKGPCPRCAEEFTFRYPIIGLQGVRPIDDAEQEREALKRMVDDLSIETLGTEADFTMYCQCAGDHDKRPPNKKGCGAYWQFHVAWG